MSYYNDLVNCCVAFLKDCGITADMVNEDYDNDLWTFLTDEENAEKFNDIGSGNLLEDLSDELMSVDPSKSDVIEYAEDLGFDGVMDISEESSDDLYDTFPELCEEYNIKNDKSFINAVKNEPEVFEYMHDLFTNSTCYGFPDEYPYIFKAGVNDVFDDILNKL